MPNMAIWAVAASSALAGAALTYFAARPRLATARPDEAPSEWASRHRAWRSWCSHHRGREHRSCRGRSSRIEPTGNAAFDEYRQQALDRLEAEAKEFREFLQRLRQARDKSEFDEFMRQRQSGEHKSGEHKPGDQGSPAA